ncbi:hypothetical protein V1478_006197 [Vespula squamosa]|uniref:Uncharacterized protein n=1 Tax=Vespula squamosa TaxID=30214 RepID=A0ABD2B781_VESSQ
MIQGSLYRLINDNEANKHSKDKTPRMAQSRSRSRIRHEQRCKLPRDKRKRFHNPIEFELYASYFLQKLHVNQKAKKNFDQSKRNDE